MLRFIDLEERLLCKRWVAVDGLDCSSCKLVRLSLSAFLCICELARLFKLEQTQHPSDF